MPAIIPRGYDRERLIDTSADVEMELGSISNGPKMKKMLRTFNTELLQ